jgi:ATP-dependent Lhr-like helicase
MPASSSDIPASFLPSVRAWFREKVGAPTDVQTRAWPLIAQGRNVLLTAPTGSGKTLTAFLWALDRFLSGAWETGATRVVYVSPLKALNNDIQRNLLAPLEQLRPYLEAEGRAFPEVRVQVRSGDTPSGERRRMLRHPPEILITTPESLNLLLLTEPGRDSLRQVETVILDEVHAVAGTKRGTHLITAVDRLVPLAGEFQRIALSATVKPLETVAAWVGGFVNTGGTYLARNVDVVESRAPKTYELKVRFPSAGRGEPGGVSRGEDDVAVAGGGGGISDNPGGAAAGAADEDSVWERVAEEIKKLLSQARSTLVFANNRRLCERLARLLNEGEETPIAYSHHGSLSREIRAVVEARMKEGRLRAIVATNSLELGIDVGALDQVILVQTPFTVASTLQKLGRAGHGVGQASRGELFAAHGRDLLAAAVAVRCVQAGDIEAVHPVENALDLLAQIIVSMTAPEPWNVDALFDFLRSSYPYRNLPRRHFDLVIEMLAGSYEAARVRELRPRVAVDRLENRVRAARGAAMLVGLSGGTIPDRGYYALRHAHSKAKIGELDEEFVWERHAGEIFALGSQSWKILRIGDNDVEVIPSERGAQMAPFWRAEARDRDAHFSLRLAEFLEEAEGRLSGPPGYERERAADFAEALSRDRRFAPGAAAELVAFLGRQKAATQRALPHRHHLLVEDCGEDPARATLEVTGVRQIVLHAPWGGRVNRPWAYALAAAWEERGGGALEVVQNDDCLMVQWPREEAVSLLLDLVHPDNAEALLRKKLEQTGYFAAHFRENAARALLLPRSTPGRRVPLWLNRLRSRRLLEAVSGFGDFPVILETWRECLRDEFDVDALKARLEELHSGNIRVTEARTAEPSPFAEGLLWKRTNRFMYEGDRPSGTAGTRSELLKDIVFSSPLRPKVPAAVIRAFEEKARRLFPGYAPQGTRELFEWAKERVLIAAPEWERLLPLTGWDAPKEGDGEKPASYLGRRIAAFVLPGGSERVVAAVETLPSLLRALGLAPEAAALRNPLPEAPGGPPAFDRPAPPEALESLLRFQSALDREEEENDLTGMFSQWLRFHGPVTAELLRGIFGSAAGKVEDAAEELAEDGKAVIDALSEEAEGPEICDAGNVESLLRLMRRRSRPAFTALPAARLPLFMAAWHGLTAPGREVEGVQGALEKLFGYPAPAQAWEADILPARIAPYQPVWLDAVFRDTDLVWYGCGKEKSSFAFPEDLELFRVSDPVPPPADSPAAAHALALLAAAAPARLDFAALAAQSPFPSTALTEALWDLAWQGRITNDTFAALRKGLETGFRIDMPEAAATRHGSGQRGRFQRWKASRPLLGAWRLVDADAAAPDPLEEGELAKERVRQLLRRHGILFRELLAHESPPLQWPTVFRALRLLELSGEVLSGQFFVGIPGLQFLDPSAFKLLESGLPGDAVYWMSAADPASPCGLALEGLPYALPPRVSGTHLVFQGDALALVSRRQGRDLTLLAPPRHRYLASYLGSLRHLIDRAFSPLKSVEVETVNGQAAAESPYLEDMLEAGFEKGLKTLALRRKFA